MCWGSQEPAKSKKRGVLASFLRPSAVRSTALPASTSAPASLANACSSPGGTSADQPPTVSASPSFEDADP